MNKEKIIKKIIPTIILIISLIFIIIEVSNTVINYYHNKIIIPPNPTIICFGIPLSIFSYIYLKF